MSSLPTIDAKWLRLATFAATCLLGWTIAAAEPQLTRTGEPDLTLDSKDYPDADAVILRWEQHWTVAKNGAVKQREHRWIKLLTARPIDDFGDPKIVFHGEQDDLTVHKAQTILPDGEIMPVPDYSYNLGAMASLAGWPSYADWKERIVSFSGLQPGAIIELDYEIATKPGVLPWVSADLRLDGKYPIAQRVITLTVPKGHAVAEKMDGAGSTTIARLQQDDAGNVMYIWGPYPMAVPAAIEEPQSLPWEQRGPRLRWSTAADAKSWVLGYLKSVRGAVKSSPEIKAFAEAAVEKQTATDECVRMLAQALHDRFNHLNAEEAYRSLKCRPADEVLKSNYGNPLEAAALLLSAIRSLDIDADVRLAVDSRTWSEDVPTDAGFAGVVVEVRGADGPIFVHPSEGVFADPGHWGGHRLLGVADGGDLSSVMIRSRTDDVVSELEATGRITLKPDGAAEGELRFQLTGGFYDPRNLESESEQQAFFKRLSGRVLGGMKMTGYAVTRLSDESLHATVELASDGPLATVGGYYALPLGQGPAFLGEFPMPLDRSSRVNAVRLRGPFREHVDVILELPKGWTAPVLPAPLERVSGDWGAVEQKTTAEDGTLRVQRMVEVRTDTLPAKELPAIRKAVNDLRADGSVTLLVGPAGKDQPGA